LKKTIVVIIALLMVFTIGGCKQNVTNPPKVEEQNPQTQDSTKPSIGNIHLGDSKDEVIKAFGSDYKETFEEDPALLGEAFYKWVYTRGVNVIIGKDTNSLLEIESSDATLETNLGAKIGDTYESINNKYGEYKSVTSNQDNSTLVGWYELGEGQIVIFDFNKNDEAMVNFNVKPDSKVEMMKLTYLKFID
jgi:hypothetical protein